MSHLLTFRHLREIKRAQGKFDYQRKEKESNEGVLIIKSNKKRATRETWLSKARKREQWGRLNYQRKEKESNEGDLIVKAHALSLSLICTHTTLQKERELKNQFSQKILKNWHCLFYYFVWWFLLRLVRLNESTSGGIWTMDLLSFIYLLHLIFSTRVT